MKSFKWSWQIPVLVTALLVAMTFVVYSYFLRLEKEDVRNLTQKKADALVKQIAQGLNERLLSFERMAHRLEQQKSFDKNAWLSDAQVYQRHLKGIDSLLVTDRQDKVRFFLSSLQREPQDIVNLNPEIWHQTLQKARQNQKLTVSHIYTRYSHEPLFLVAIPLVDQGGWRGTLVVVNRLELFFGNVMDLEGYESEIIGDKNVLFSNISVDPEYLRQKQVVLKLKPGSEFWTLKLVPKPYSLARSETSLPLIVLISGLVFALFSGVIVHLAFGLRQRSRDLEMQRQFLNTVIDHLPVAVFCKDARNSYRFSLWNKKCEELFGVSRQDVIGTAEPTLVGTKNDEVFAHENFIESTYHEIETDGIAGSSLGRVVLQTLKITVQGAGQAPQYVIGIVEDVTQRRRNERALKDSEQKFAAFMEHNPAMTWIKSEDGAFTFVNSRVCEVFQTSRDKILGQRTIRNVPDEASQKSHSDDVEVLHDKKSVNVVQKIVGLDGQDHFWGIYKFPMMLSSGKMFLGGVAFEITERIQAERELKATSETLRVLFRSSPLPAMILNVDGTVRNWSAACETVFGWSAEEVVGHWPPFVPAHKRRESRRIVESILMSESRSHQVEVTRMRKDGSPIEVSVNSTAVYDGKSSRPTAIISILTDISDRKLAERQLKEAKEQAEKVGQMKSDFLASVSHEIRTPLNGVIGMTDLLLETPLNEEQKKYAEIVQHSGSMLLGLINDILDLSKIESGKLTLEQTDFSLASLVEGHASLLIAKAREKNLSLMTFVDPALPGQVIGDPSRVGQILVNLIGNAIKFTHAGGVSVKVTRDVSSSAHRCRVRFEVHDTGIGLSPAGKAKLFQAFSQAESSTSRKYGGTGLGLSICKKLAEAMDGEIGVESSEGQGATFWFVISFSPSQNEESSLKASKNIHEARVLVVENDAIARDILHSYLDSWGLDGTLIGYGQDPLATLQAAIQNGRGYDLVLMGQESGSEEAFDLAAKLSAKLRPSPKMILMNSFETRVPVSRLKEAHFSAGLSKPLKQSQLFDSLVQTLTASTDTVVDYAVGSASVEVSGPKSKPRPSELRVLVVDDVSTNQVLVLKLLESLGYSGHAVGNGREALKALELGPYDLVLMDCQMPEMDGFEATRHLRASANPRLAQIPILALTANAMAGDRQQCLDAGMNDYLTKPVKKDKLAALLELWIKPLRKAG